MRGLIAAGSALAVVGTGVAIGWGSHVFQSRHAAQDTQNLAAPTALVSDSQAAPGGGTGTSAPAASGGTAKGGTAPPATAAQPAPATTASGPAAPKANIPKATGPGKISVLHVPSADKDIQTRDVYVYRPAVPDDVVLPVVYLLHGVPGEASTILNVVQPALDAAFTTGGQVPFEVAAPSGGGNAHSDTEWADAADGADLIETYLIKQVLPAVEGATPRSAAQRAVVGFSMGGYGAANLTLRHPDMFNQFVAMAGYFHVDDPSGMFNNDSALEAANNPDAMVKQAANKRVLLLEDADESDPLISGQAQEFAARLKGCGCNVDTNWRIVPGGHDYDFLQSAFTLVVGFLDRGF
jgi:S-formylglutathione hydrolase FrmB